MYGVLQSGAAEVNLYLMSTNGDRGHVILGIDPGTATTGWGVIRQDGNKLRHIQHAVITTPSDWEMPRRLAEIHDRITDLIQGYRPSAVAIEELFFNTNVTTAITVGQSRGVAVLAAYKAGVPVSEYTPLQVKQAITSYGRADKKQVQEMVRALLNLRGIPRPDDAADGLAIAITHAFSSRMSGKVGVGKQRFVPDN